MLKNLIETANETIASGYYRGTDQIKDAPSLVRAIDESPHDPAIIAEIKPASPLKARKVPEGGFEGSMKRFLAEGACGLSVLTEPRHFNGSLANLKAAVALRRPTLMKDFILAEEQIDCAASLGASAVLLIVGVLPKSRVTPLIEYAHLAEREVLLECGSKAELELALETDADMVGINNRDLRTFGVDLDRTLGFTEGVEVDRPLVSLSGFARRADVQRVAGVADACLVGSALMEGLVTVEELVRP